MRRVCLTRIYYCYLGKDTMRAFLSTEADTELMIFYGKFAQSELWLMSAVVLLFEKPEGACHLERIFQNHRHILLYNYCTVLHYIYSVYTVLHIQYSTVMYYITVQHESTFIRRFQSSSIQRNIYVRPKLRTVTFVETYNTFK